LGDEEQVEKALGSGYLEEIASLKLRKKKKKDVAIIRQGDYLKVRVVEEKLKFNV
jgi:hypothetical protein